MRSVLSKSISVWPRPEVFSYGIFPMQPHPRIATHNIRRLISYTRLKSASGCPRLSYVIWKHVACTKLGFSEEAAWIYFEACLILSCPKMEYLIDMENAISRSKDSADLEKNKSQQTLNLYTFALYLYVNQINRLSLRSSVASVSAEWPGLPSTDLEMRSPTFKKFKNTSEQFQLQYVSENLLEMLELISESSSEAPANNANPGFLEDRRISTATLEALSFLFEGTTDHLSSIRSLRDILFDPMCSSHVGFNKTAKTFNVRSLYVWLRASLCQCPFSMEACILNGTRIHWDMNTATASKRGRREGSGSASSNRYGAESPVSSVSSSSASSNASAASVQAIVASVSRQKIATNVNQVPPSTGFRGNKLLVASLLHRQVIARSSRFLKNATVKLHRITSSFIYFLTPLRCVTLDRCRGSTIVLGPIESTLIIHGCENCTVIAPTRRVIVTGSRKCTLHLLCPTRPLMLHPISPLATTTPSTGASSSSSTPSPTSPTTPPPPAPPPIASGCRAWGGNTEITLAPYHTAYPDLKHHLDRSALDPTNNLWDQAVIFGHDFLRPSDISHLKKKAVFGLLPPAAFFPFNIPLAPIWSPPDSEERQLLLQSSLLDNTSTSAPSVRLRQQACDVCRGTLVGAGCCAIEKTDGDDDEFDAADGGGTQQPSKTTSLVVPLPRVYAAAVKKRAAAYENWHKLVQDADLTDEDLATFSTYIEKRFQFWLSETGCLKELQLLNAAANLLSPEPAASIAQLHPAKGGGGEEEDKTLTPSPTQRRPHLYKQHRRQISPNNAI